MSADIDGVLALVRSDLQAFAGYSSARSHRLRPTRRRLRSAH